jgi:hypothetical protein
LKIRHGWDTRFLKLFSKREAVRKKDFIKRVFFDRIMKSQIIAFTNKLDNGNKNAHKKPGNS